MDERPESVQIPLVWIGAEEAPILMVTSFLGQSQDDEIVLTFGQMTPPILFGSEEDRLQQVQNIHYLPVKTIAKLGFTRQRLQELTEVLRQTLENFDKGRSQ
jgi:hypothetical protein